MRTFNTLRPRQNGHRFADDTFKRIFLNENVRISIKISLNFVPKGPINNNPALVQIMAWRRSGDKPLSEPMMVSLLTHICVTRPQWVNDWFVINLNKLLNKQDHKQHKKVMKIGLKFYNNRDAGDRSGDTTVMEETSSSRYQSTDNKNALFVKTYITSLWRHWIFYYASSGHSPGSTLVTQALTSWKS